MKNTKFNLILVVCSGILILTGCSQVNDNSKKNNDNTEVVTYHSEKGDIEIPKNPKAIVSDYYVGELEKLDANLIGADLSYIAVPWKNEISDVVDVGQSIEKVASLNPDLIITKNENMYEQYSDIAPTVYIPYEKYYPKELMLELGKITNREAEAKQWIDEFDQDIEKLKQEIDNPNLTYSLVQVVDDQIYVYGDNWGRGGYILYNQLGLKAPKKSEETLMEDSTGWVSPNKEDLPNYIGDVVFFLNDDNINLGDTIYKDLPAVKNNQVYEVNSDEFWWNDPYSLNAQVDYFMDFFADEKY